MKKLKEATWKKKDGKIIRIGDMEDNHLANSMKMMGRLWGKTITKNSKFILLLAEAQKRGFHVTILKTSRVSNGREEYIEIIIPTSIYKLSSYLIESELDSRPHE